MENPYILFFFFVFLYVFIFGHFFLGCVVKWLSELSKLSKVEQILLILPVQIVMLPRQHQRHEQPSDQSANSTLDQFFGWLHVHGVSDDHARNRTCEQKWYEC